MEKNCSWHFKPEGSEDRGPNDPLHITFKGNYYYSIVREAIQNSMDVVDEPSNPVKVSFQTFQMSRLDFPNFFEIEKHIDQCLEHYNGNRNAKLLFGEMKKYLRGEENGKKRVNISCLKISDENTTGMYYDESTKSPFYGFLRSSGVSNKNHEGAGGSFGFGKGAYFALSPIKTIVVSSRDKNNNVYFEGATRLTTHKDKNGEKISAIGFYDNNYGEPTVEENKIPDLFKREKQGTDINIIGLWNRVDWKDWKRTMIKSVLNNFWLAIHDKLLSVQIEDKEISSENLSQYMDDYFGDETEDGSVSDIEGWNPKPYYKAVKYAGSNDTFRVFSEDLPTLGKVKLFVYLNKGLPNRISFFRSPRMVVYKQTKNKLHGYSAVFLCDDPKGDKILRDMENPAHNEWKYENYPEELGEKSKLAKDARSEIDAFVNDSLESLSSVNAANYISISGLDEYLSISEDLIDREEKEINDGGEGLNDERGTISEGVPSESETPIQTTNSDFTRSKIKPTVKSRPSSIGDLKAEIDNDGDEEVSAGGENETSGGNQPGEGNTGAGRGSSNPESEGENKVLIPTNFKSYVQSQNGEKFHFLIVNPEKRIDKGEIEIFVGSDNGKNETPKLNWSDYGLIDGNKLKNLSLNEGRNLIKIKFSNDLSYSLKLRLYEL